MCEYYVIGNLLLHKSKERSRDLLLKHELLSAMMNNSLINGWIYKNHVEKALKDLLFNVLQNRFTLVHLIYI